MSRPAVAALGVVVLALVARLAAAIALGDRLHFDDEGIYADAAARLAGGMGFGAGYRNVPGYPVVLAALRVVAPDGVLGLRVAQAAFTAAGVTVVMALARALAGPRVALAAGLLYALDPLLVVAGALLYPEAVAAVVMAALVVVALRAAGRDDARRTALAGVLLGALALLRPVALVLAPALACWLVVVVAAPPSRRARLAVLVLLACGATLVPWTVRNYRLHGVVTPIAVAGTHTAPVSPSEARTRGLTRALLQRVRDDPRSFAAHAGREFLHFWELYPQRLATDNPRRRAVLHGNDPRLPAEATFPAAWRDRVSAAASALEFGLALAGVVVVWGRNRTAAALLLAMTLAFAAGYAPFIGKMRYRIPVLPLVLVLAGVGAVRLGGRTPARPIGP
jgi:hypothetical protein